MNLGRGRAPRPDDWPSSHVRARAALSERLDATLDPAEDAWLDGHLDACADCRAIAESYASQRLELRALRDRMPPPPRDLWARTAAAIESEARFRDGRTPSRGWRASRSLAPTALLAAALVVAVAVGTLTSSQRPLVDGDTGSPPGVALATPASASSAPGGGSGATPIPAPRKMAYLTQDEHGVYSVNVRSVDEVCPDPASEPCATNTTVERRTVKLDQNASTVFAAPDDSALIVVNDPTASNGGTVSVVSLASNPPTAAPTPTPSVTPTIPSAPPTPSAVATPSVRPSKAPPSSSATPSVTPSAAPTPTPTPSADVSPTPSVSVTPSPDGSIEIAHDVVVVGQSAAYSASGDWFAFTARPIDLSAGPDIYVWKVGEAQANRVTSDHQSVFGSWMGNVMVGSTVVVTSTGEGAAAKVELEPASFLLDPATSTRTELPQTGKAWRPAVDPSGRLAVYWSGTLRPTSVPEFAPDSGRLVLGDWGTGSAGPSDGPLPTTLTGDQIAIRHETTLATGQMDDWDARWDSDGTHLAVWIADAQNPAIGRLSLYAVSSFDGKIDLRKPLLSKAVAAAGFSISEGKLVWAEPSDDGTVASGTIQLLAWTNEGVGTVKTVTGPVIVIR